MTCLIPSDCLGLYAFTSQVTEQEGRGTVAPLNKNIWGLSVPMIWCRKYH